MRKTWFLKRSATRNPGLATTSTQNFAEYEILKRMFHDTANRCQRNSLCFTPVVFDGHAGGWGDSARNLVTWVHPTTSLRTPSDITSTWLSAPLRHSTVTPRVPFFDVSDRLPRETPPHLSVTTVGWWPACRWGSRVVLSWVGSLSGSRPAVRHGAHM